ncbi:hypothetical protein [Neoroseomonas lacus]|uniref:Uncharacterized protein n=1 Tax=Neoroseomonas lacus TaxID=287609 RepID=A0A917KPZ4_9PROT|nr:hypothetical protein [Neoroseomonas lacus]GGJ22003.1 hypothetical protein GCM10011320_31540 [Neoroseomonas lacus]
MRMRLGVVLLPLVFAACEELRTPQALPPAVLTTEASHGPPLRAAVAATTADFANQGANLAGQPAKAALALARFEALELEVANRRAWPSISPTIGYAMRTARNENRAAIGAAQEASSADVIHALGLVSARLRANDRAGAAAALTTPTFEPGGEVTLGRLGEIGPLPAAEQAMAALDRDVRHLDLDAGWSGGGNWWQSGAPGAITDGLGRGY